MNIKIILSMLIMFSICHYLKAAENQEDGVIIEIYRDKQPIVLVDPFADEETKEKQKLLEDKKQKEQDKKSNFELKKSIIIRDEFVKNFFLGLARLKEVDKTIINKPLNKDKEAPWVGVSTYILVKNDSKYIGRMIYFEGGVGVKNNIFILSENKLHKTNKDQTYSVFESENFVNYLRKFVALALE